MSYKQKGRVTYKSVPTFFVSIDLFRLSGSTSMWVEFI